jgi:hypothetical protein
MLFIASIVSFVFLVFSNYQEWQNIHVKGVCDVYTSIIKTSLLKLFGRKKRAFEDPYAITLWKIGNINKKTQKSTFCMT